MWWTNTHISFVWWASSHIDNCLYTFFMMASSTTATAIAIIFQPCIFLYGCIQRKHIKRNRNRPLNLLIRVLLLIFFCNYFELEKKNSMSTMHEQVFSYPNIITIRTVVPLWIQLNQQNRCTKVILNFKNKTQKRIKNIIAD